MTISTDYLRNASTRFSAYRPRTIVEARTMRLSTVFLCHSHKDEQLVKGLVVILQEAGWQVYVDWADSSMPDVPTRQTAETIKQKIEDLDYFLFLATANSMASKWCPWEIGYADGKKHIDSILVLPTADRLTTHGSEYLQLYRRVDLSNAGQLAVWQPRDTQNGVLVRNL